MEDKKVEIDQIFLAEEILPNPLQLFEDEPKGLEVAIQDAIIVLDTNVLLIPYGAGASSLSEIMKVYEEIKGQGCLCIPSQVAREFVKNRPNKLAQLDKGISDRVSALQIPKTLSYPILESVKEFDELNQQLAEIEDLKNKLNKSARKVRRAIKTWGWNDPVTQAYRPIFTSDIIVDPEVDREQAVAEMQRRYSLLIPPGYKDASKPDSGIGDFLIWKTILKLGSDRRSSVVFVSGDEKADWFHGSGGNGFLPRYELQAEFRRITDGHDLYIIQLSELLELKKAEASSVDEIRTEENRIREATIVLAECPVCGGFEEHELAEPVGSSATPTCSDCCTKFHLHRTRDGVVTHEYNSRSGPTIEKVECPYCGIEMDRELGLHHNATGWCICDGCDGRFPIHRKRDGSVHISAIPTD